jgi:RND family efflux transporter MFP subunit
MNNQPKSKAPFRATQVIIRILICIAILVVGFLAMNKLAKLKKPPVEAKQSEHVLQVKGLIVATEDIQTTLSGYGEVKSSNTVSIASEVSGRVVYVHPRLEVGGIIARGQTLFKVDSRVYAATQKEAVAALHQLEITVLRLEKQYALDQERQATIERNRELAGQEYQRLQQLFEVNNVGTLSGVDKAEQAYNAAIDQADQMARALALYPLQIQEITSSIEAAQARIAIASVNLERCRITAPFEGRVKSVAVEVGQIVSPGQPVITLADDASLEIQVTLDARDARQWLQLEANFSNGSGSWFSKPLPVPCRITWTDNPKAPPWKGKMDRVVEFNSQTRTLTVAVQFNPQEQSRQEGRSFPLVEGMFCRVDIPGKSLHNVIRLPRWSVSFENTVYVANDQSRLITVPVTVVRSEGEEAFISKGLNPGQTVIVTRLTDPLENSLLAVTLDEY